MTKISIANAAGARVARVVQLDISSGSQIELTATRGSATAIYLDRNTANALQPVPDGLMLSLAPNQSTTLVFGDVQPVEYSITVQSPDAPAPAAGVPVPSASAVLNVRCPGGSDYHIPTSDTQDNPSGTGDNGGH